MWDRGCSYESPNNSLAIKNHGKIHRQSISGSGFVANNPWLLVQPPMLCWLKPRAWLKFKPLKPHVCFWSTPHVWLLKPQGCSWLKTPEVYVPWSPVIIHMYLSYSDNPFSWVLVAYESLLDNWLMVIQQYGKISNFWSWHILEPTYLPMEYSQWYGLSSCPWLQSIFLVGKTRTIWCAIVIVSQVCRDTRRAR